MKSKDKVLNHISFIMDGNGRWAQKRLLPRSAGHAEGVKKAKEIILEIRKRGIPYVSLYVFSKENWKRSSQEVSFLMGLLIKHLQDDFQFYIDNKIKIKHIGDRDGLSKEILAAIDRVERETKEFDSVTVLLVFNYSGKYDIIQAVNKLLETQKGSECSEADFASHLLTAGYPDPDLIVRTSGEFRISNYFLWQASYSEFYIMDRLWPDVTGDDIDKAIASFYGRERRFGGVSGNE